MKNGTENKPFVKSMTKTAQILDFMLQGNSITQKIAAEKFNAWRLSDSIYKIKKLGYQIETRAEVHNGGIHSRYWLIVKKIELPPAFEKAEINQAKLF
jgi:hypothetical protein